MATNTFTQRKKITQIVSRMRALVADDFSTMRNVIVNTLRSMGFVNIDQASNGKVILQHLKSNKYDLLLCDWNMPPFMDGVEILETLKETGQLEDIIFIMITAERSAHNVIRAAEAILDGYLVKPIRTETIEKILIKILLKKQILRKGKEIFFERGEDEAVKYYEEELEKIVQYDKHAGQPLWLHKAIAEIYEKAGDLKREFEKHLEILKINPKSAWTYEAMGQIYKKRGDTQKAIEAFQKALDCNQHFMKAADSMATILLENNREDEALSVIEKASEFGTDNVKRQILLEQIYAKKKDYEKAADVANHIISLQPRINTTENYTRLAKNFMLQKKLGLAYDAITTAIQKRDPLTTSSTGLRKAYLVKSKVCLHFKELEKKEEAGKGFRYVLNVLKKDKEDNVSRSETESEIMEIYKRLGKEEDGIQAIKRINEEYKQKTG